MNVIKKGRGEKIMDYLLNGRPSDIGGGSGAGIFFRKKIVFLMKLKNEMSSMKFEKVCSHFLQHMYLETKKNCYKLLSK